MAVLFIMVFVFYVKLPRRVIACLEQQRSLVVKCFTNCCPEVREHLTGYSEIEMV